MSKKRGSEQVGKSKREKFRTQKNQSLSNASNILLNPNAVKNYCVHEATRHGGEAVIAQFYCFKENVFVCDDCFEDHKEHGVMADSIKNHLGRFFNEWLHLHDHAVNVTQVKLE